MTSINKKTLIYATIGLGGLASCVDNTKQTTAEVDDDEKKMNVLIILADDIGWSDLGCYGNKFHETPNIDRLATEGLLFTNAYAACPVSSPTRASILTGKYPATLNITDWIPGRQSHGPRPNEKLISPKINNELKLEEVTIAEVLKQFDYKTFHVGKWHLGGSGYLPKNQGFDVNIAGNHKGSPPGYFYPYKKTDWSGKEYELPYMNKVGKERDYLTDLLTTEAIKLISDNKDSTFFMYLSYYTVHIPIQGKPELVDYYSKKRGQSEDTLNKNPHYAAMVHSFDQNVGRMLRTLDSLGLSKNTIVLLSSDNGGLSVVEGKHTPATNNYPLRHGKGYMYEGGIREPLLVRWPNIIKPGTTTNKVVTSVDIFPTILEALKIPERKTQGKSFLSLLQGDTSFIRGPVFWHYPHYSNQGGKPSGAIRYGDYKLIQNYEDGSFELYNLREDISEKNNLVNEQKEKAEELLNLLKNWKTNVKAKPPVSNTNYDSTWMPTKENMEKWKKKVLNSKVKE